MPLQPGQTLGPYAVLEKLGEGGMGEVYKARDTRLGRMVALKCLPPDKVADPVRRQRFLQEAQAASALNHPGIITIHDWIEDGAGNYVLVMEFVPGKTLDQVIPAKGLRLPDTLRYAAQIADALAAAHAAGIIHRDVKPANVMITEQKRVKVLDFGLAKLEEVSASHEDDSTRTAQAISEEGTVAGSAPYMSPEQAEGKKIDARSDIFSFGAVLYEMVTGQRAFQGDTRASTMAAVLKSDPKPAAQIAVDALPKELDRVITRCLRKDLERRSQSMAEIKLALEEIREESESGVQPAGDATASRRRRPFWMIPALAGGAIAVVAVVAWILPRNADRPAAPSYRVRQITRDEASSFQPAMSPDGKFVVYASNRGGQRDLWLQLLSGGEPVRLTNNPVPESSPSFSPDGSQILFRTPEGLSLISALGGAERQIVMDTTNLSGWQASFSPDGKWIAYKSGSELAVGNALLVIPVGGGDPKTVVRTRDALVGVAWSPDSRRLLVATPIQPRGTWYGPYKWTLYSLADGSSTLVSGMEYLKESGINEPKPQDWLADGNRVIVSGWDEANHVWQVPMTAAGQIAGPPVRLTNGAGETPGPPSSGGGIIPFMTGSFGRAIYALPLDVKRAVATGSLQKITRGEGVASFPSLTGDGSKMLYLSDRLGNPDLWLRDNRTGEERVIVASPHRETRGLISPDGSKISLQRIENGKLISYWRPLTGGAETMLCDGCRSLLSWTPDSQEVIISEGHPETMVTINIHTGRHSVVAAHPKLDIHDVKISPDGKWFVAKLFAGALSTKIFVAPYRPGNPAPESEWIVITTAPDPSKPLWTPDGNMLYYFHRQDLVAQRLDPQTKKPVGDPITVFRATDSGRSVPLSSWVGYGLAADRIYMALGEGQSHVWVAEAEKRQ